MVNLHKRHRSHVISSPAPYQHHYRLYHHHKHTQPMTSQTGSKLAYKRWTILQKTEPNNQIPNNQISRLSKTTRLYWCRAQGLCTTTIRTL